MPRVVLKPGKSFHRHPWIFSGAIASRPSHEPGEIFPVYSSEQKLLGSAYFHPTNSIAGRMISFSDQKPLDAIRTNLEKSIAFRHQFVPYEARRLVNAEGDELPGLIVDQYKDVLVLQISTAGMERLKPFLVEELIRLVQPKTIYEKCLSPARRQEGLSDAKGLLYGIDTPEITITEHGISHIVPLLEGQKTGLFLDQREMRKKILELSAGKKVLNCFSYTGGFSLAALKGGASFVHSVDISSDACKICERNNFDPYEPAAKLQFGPKSALFAQDSDSSPLSDQGAYSQSSMSPECDKGEEAEPGQKSSNLGSKASFATGSSRHTILCADAFEFLAQQPLNYDIVILDPPAFAKKRSDVDKAAQGYREINRRALQKMPSGSFLLTSSCSSFIDKTLFQQIIFQAASDAKRSVQIVGSHLLAMDHPISIFHPEGEYLKSLLLYIQ